jgi:hypothetical protein
MAGFEHDGEPLKAIVATYLAERLMGFFVVGASAAALLILTGPGAARREERERGSGYPGVRLVTVDRVAVFASFLGAQSPRAVCPRLPLPLRATALQQAAAAVAHAMPAFYRRAKRPGSPHIDARGATAQAGRAATAHAGTDFRRFCGDEVWQRSAFVAVRLPRVRFSASLSRPSFLVSRTRLGWIIWAEVH